MKNIILFFAMIILLGSCGLSDKEIDKLKKECISKDSLVNLSFTVEGFPYSEVQSILIKEIQNSVLVDSFYVQIPKSSNDSTVSLYGTINKTIHLKSNYQFFIPGQPPFVLSEMKLSLVEQHSMFSKVYICDLNEYSINGKIYTGRNPLFKKGI